MVSKKLNLLISLTVIVILTASFRGCECKKRELDAIDKEWVKAYSMGQLIVFKSNLNHFDSVKVSSIRDFYTTCNKFEVSDFQDQIISIELTPNICYDKDYCAISLEIRKKNEKKTVIPFIRVLTLEYSPSIQNEKLEMSPIKLSTTNKQYKYAMIFSVKVSAKSFGSHYLKNFYWDKEDGLIRYTTSKNEVFELLSKSSVH